MKIGKFALLIFTVCIGACTAPAVDESVSEKPMVTIIPVDVTVEPFCGFELDRVGEGYLTASLTRITPSDQNGVIDLTEFETTAGVSIGAINIVREVTCDNRRSLAPDSSDSLVWDGRTDEGEFAEPGSYFVIAKDAAGDIVGLDNIMVAARDTQCAVAQNQQELINTRVAFRGMKLLPDRDLDVSGPGWLCLTVERLGDTQTAPYVGLNDGPLFSPRAFTANTRSVDLAIPLQGASRLQLGGVDGSFRVQANFVADTDVVPTSQGTAVEDLPETLTCHGRLVGSPHPFDVESRPHWTGLDEERFPEGRRPVPREGINVRCVVQFHIAELPEAQSLIRRSDGGHVPDIARFPAAVSVGHETVYHADVAPMIVRGEGGGLSDGFRPVFALADQLPGVPGIPGDLGFDPGGVVPVDPFPIPPPPPEEYITYFADGVTDATGAYHITVELDERAEGKPYRYKYAKCIDWLSDCAGNVRVTREITDTGPNDIWDVNDYQLGDISARLITNAGVESVGGGQIRRPILEQSVVLENAMDLGTATIPSDGIFIPEEMNDLPIVIHEPFDPLDSNGYEYLVWLLGGQPMALEPAQTLCDAHPTQLCYGPHSQCEWQPDCSATSAGVQCRAQNVLKMLLEAGYDVWVVDHGYDASIERVVPWAPTMWQNIVEYPFEDEERKVAISGLSSGGVVARVALKLAERKTELGALNTEFGTNFQLRNPNSLTAIPNRVAAFFSFDSPHLGATVPVALQAYLHDDEFAKDTHLDNLLTSKAAQELLSNHVDNDIDTACFEEEGFLGLIGNTEVPKTCTVQPSTPELEDYIIGLPALIRPQVRRAFVDPDLVSSDGVDKLVRDTIDILGDSEENEGLQIAFPDGLPSDVPSFGITNGQRYGAGTVHSENEVLKTTIEMPNSTRTQKILDFHQQPPGSTYPGICEAMTLDGGPGERIGAVAGLLEDCYDRAGIPLVCDVGGILGGAIKKGLAGLGIIDSGSFSPIEVDIEVPMRFPTFISAESALIAPGGESTRGGYAFGWNDVLWAEQDQLHFEVSDEACRFVRYHLDGTMKGDRDGVPGCRVNMLQACADGGMSPGQALAPANAYASNPGNFCDCDDAELDVIGMQRCRVVVEQPRLARD